MCSVKYLKIYRTPVLIIIFYIKSILYPKIMLSQKFWIKSKPFTSVVLCTQTLHQQWLHTRTYYKNLRSATIRVIKFELKIVDQIDMSVSFWPKRVKCWNFEGDCVPNGYTGKVATWGVLIYSWNMTFSDEMQNFFKVIERSVLTTN